MAAASAAAPSDASPKAAEGPGEEQMQKWRLHVAYDGTDFCGWQKQPEFRTIQEDLDISLGLVFRTEIRTVGASRTDSGVHARGQVCHFEAPGRWGPRREPGLEPEVALRRLRRELPGAILAVALGRVEMDFHARLTALRKRYSYQLALVDAVSPFEARYTWCCGSVDVDAMSAAAAELSGRALNYSAFAMGEHEPEYHGSEEKVTEIFVRREGPDRLLVFVACDRFLYKMVRRIVGALVEVGKGRLRPEAIATADRKSIPTAPPGGLCLNEVEYPAEFPPPERAATAPEELAAPPWPS